jgi:hypothetical protein
MVNAFPIKNKFFNRNFFKLKSVIVCIIQKYLIFLCALVYKATNRPGSQREMPAGHTFRRVPKKWSFNGSS